MVGLAFALVIMSAVLHACWNFLTKRVSGNLSVLYIGMAGACLVLLPIVLLFRTTVQLLPAAYPLIVATGVIHAIYFLVLSQAYRYGNISTVYPVARGSGVIGTAIVAIMLLGEEVSLLGMCGIISAGLGVFFIGTSAGQGIESKKGLHFGLLVGLTMIGYSIVDKIAMASIDPVVYIFWLFLLSMLLLTPCMLLARRRQLAEALRKHKRDGFIIGLGATAGYLLILFVFRMAQVSYVVAVRELSVVFGSILGFAFLHESGSVRKFLGIILVVTGLILIRVA